MRGNARSFLIGLLAGLVFIPLAALFYLKFGKPPVAVTDKPFPLEKQIVHIPLDARIQRDLIPSAPMLPSSENLQAGAQLYRQNCAACHGLTNAISPFGAHMYPWAPQLLQAHGQDHVVGVSDDPVGETYWKVANGIRLTGMPSFSKILSNTEMWQVSLLMANADKTMPQPVMDLLNKPLVY